MTEQQCMAALEALNYSPTTEVFGEIKIDAYKYMLNLSNHYDVIRAALQAPQPEEVTVEELWDLFLNDAYENHPEDGSCMEEWYAEYLRIKYPHGIRIIREKSE